MPVARNLDPAGVQAQWQRAKLGGWLLMGLSILSILCWLLSRTVFGVWSLFSPSGAVGTQGRDFSSISSDKASGDSLSTSLEPASQSQNTAVYYDGIYRSPLPL